MIKRYSITIDGRPYQGEDVDIEPAKPLSAYHSPISRNKIKVGHPLDTAIKIEGNRNLRSHIDRILTRMAEGHEMTTIQITKL